VKVDVLRTGSARKAEAALLQDLCAGRPVMLQVDMGYLPYFNFPEEYHFGGHAIVACGYDPDSRQVLVADRELAFYPVAMEDLERARGSKWAPFCPEHAQWRFDFSGFHSPLPEELRAAMREVSQGMLHPPITNLGVTGMRKAARRTLDWPKSMDARALRNACFNIFIFIDAAGGTGGGLFRYLYARFLAEAAPLMGDSTLESALLELSSQLQSIGDRWQELAERFKQAADLPDPAPALPGCVSTLPEIAAQEQAVWQRLAALAA
jgi:hypothetical protein